MPIYKVAIRQAGGGVDKTLDISSNPCEVCERLKNLGVATDSLHSIEFVADEKKVLSQAQSELLAIFHNVINIGSIGIKLTDRAGDFSEKDWDELFTLADCLKSYAEKALEWINVALANTGTPKGEAK